MSPVHFVWATQGREAFVTEQIGRKLHKFIANKTNLMGATVLAVGGMPDHVHLAVLFPATLSYADFMAKIKGAASFYATHTLLQPNDVFAWQEGYGAFGFSLTHRDKVIAYIHDQKRHHETNHLWPALEATEPPKANLSHEIYPATE